MPAYVDKPFPPNDLVLESVIPLIGRANACLSRYDGLLESLVNPAVLLSPLLMKEAELSSKIEGTVATASEVYQQQAGEEFDPAKKADIHEILNYRSTLRIAGVELATKNITLHLIREMHENLMQGVRGKDNSPGKFRVTQNWIGSPGCPIERATYIPPPPLLVNELLEQFIMFLNISDGTIDPIVQAALMHAQFELIHPFDDGNGRIGRLLIPLFLMKRGSIMSPSFYVSRFLEANRDVYYDRLEGISKRNNWLAWIEFFLQAVITQAENNLHLVRKVIELYETTKREIADLLHSDQGIYLLDMLFDTPVFSANKVHSKLGIQRQRAALYVRALKNAGIIRLLRPPRGSRAALYSFEALMRITDQQ